MNRIVKLLGAAVVRVPWAVVGITLLITAVLGYFSGQQKQVDFTDGFSPDNPQLRALERSGELFGEAESFMQILVSSDDGDVISADGVAAAVALEQAVRASEVADRLADRADQPAVISYLSPVFQAASFSGADPAQLPDDGVDQLYLQAMSQMPAQQADLLAAMLPEDADRTAAHSPSGLMLVLLELSDLQENDDFEGMIAVQAAVADTVADADLPAGISASAFSVDLLFEDDGAFEAEIARLFSLAALVIMVILAVVYFIRPRRGEVGRLAAVRRSLADVALTLVGIFAAISWTNGFGVLLSPDYLNVIGHSSPISQIVPILLIGLGVDYAIHLTSRYREEIADGASVVEATQRAVGTVGVALILATFTTVVGFLTNLTNPMPVLRDWGILSAIGIASAFLVMLTLVPSVRLLLDRRAERGDRLPRTALASTHSRLLPEMMARAAVFAEHAPAVTLGVTLVLAAVGGYGLSQLDTKFSFTDFADENSPLIATYDALTEDFGGGFGESADVVLFGDVATPEAHNAFVDSIQRLADVRNVRVAGGQPVVNAPPTLLAGLLAGGQAADGTQLEPPPELLAAAAEAGLGEDLKVAAEADVSALYDTLAAVAPEQAAQILVRSDDGSYAARASIQTQAGDTGGLALSRDLDEAFAPMEGAGLEATATSLGIVNAVIIQEIQDSQVTSLVITLAAALVLLVTVFWARARRPLLGVITVFPVGLVLLWTFGLMAALGIPFGPATATISALAIGIGVPFTIHITHRFQEDRLRFATPEEAIRSTTRHTGGALAGSAFTTMAGFGVLAFSSLVPFQQLGIVTAIAIGCALVASVLVLPSLLVLWDRYHRSRDRSPTQLKRVPAQVQ